ncbi:hypothetical protein V2J09_009758 [Rumex salicifolius]
MSEPGRTAYQNVCVACLLPLFLIPVVNALPLLFYIIMARVYRLFGWEYVRPERTPPACPFKPAAKKNIEENAETEPGVKENTPKAREITDNKND